MKFATAACVALVSCAQPTVIKEPIEVRVPVAVACVPMPVVVPLWATDQLAPAATYYERTKAVVEELAQRIAYEVELRAVIDGCAGKKP